jgi:hypothetical protein
MFPIAGLGCPFIPSLFLERISATACDRSMLPGQRLPRIDRATKDLIICAERTLP